MEQLENEIFKSFFGKTFRKIQDSSDWIKLPLSIKENFLRNIDNEQGIEEVEKWYDYRNKYLVSFQNEIHANYLKYKIEGIEFTLSFFKNHEVDAKRSILLKFREEIVQLKYVGHSKMSEQDILHIDQYFANKIEILNEQAKNIVYEDVDIEKSDIKAYNELKTKSTENLLTFSFHFNKKNDFNENILIECFFKLFFIFPDFSKSNIDNFNAFPFSAVKVSFKDLCKKTSLSNQAINNLKNKLVDHRIELDKMVVKARKAYENENPKRITVRTIIARNIAFNENIIALIDQFIYLVDNNYLSRRSKVNKVESFSEILTDKKRFNNIKMLLYERGFLIKNSEKKYIWNSRNAQIVTLLEKLNELSLLKPQLEDGKYRPYGKLLSKEFNFKFNTRLLQKSSPISRTENFSFLNNC